MSMTELGHSTPVGKFSEGMRKLKTAALLQIIAWLLLFAALIIGYGAIFAVLGTSIGVSPGHTSPSDIAGHLGMIFGTMIGIIAAGLVGFVLALVATYGYLLPAASDFAKYNEERYSTVSTLLKVGYLGGLLAVLGGITVAVIGILASLIGFILIGVIIVIVGLILFIVGEIGLILLMFKLKDDTGEDSFLIAGIFFIIGIFIPLFTIIAWILIYVAAKPEARPVRGPVYSGSDVLPPPPPA